MTVEKRLEYKIFMKNDPQWPINAYSYRRVVVNSLYFMIKIRVIV
jgi:hypothetical protein